MRFIHCRSWWHHRDFLCSCYVWRSCHRLGKVTSSLERRNMWINPSFYSFFFLNYFLLILLLLLFHKSTQKSTKNSETYSANRVLHSSWKTFSLCSFLHRLTSNSLTLFLKKKNLKTFSPGNRMKKKKKE